MDACREVLVAGVGDIGVAEIGQRQIVAALRGLGRLNRRRFVPLLDGRLTLDRAEVLGNRMISVGVNTFYCQKIWKVLGSATEWVGRSGNGGQER